MKILLNGKSYVTTPRFKKIAIVAATTFVALTTSTITILDASLTPPKVEAAIEKPIQEDVVITSEIAKQYITEHTVKLNAAVEVKELEPKPVFVPLHGIDLINLDLRKPSNLTAEQLDSVFVSTKLEGLGEAFVKAEKKFNVNALYLASHAVLESGWGTSSIAKNKNNIFGFTAYDANPSKHSSSFKSKTECIMHVAEYISVNYLDEEGQHYNGPTIKGMNVKYAKDQQWSAKIAEIMESAEDKIMTAQAY